MLLMYQMEQAQQFFKTVKKQNLNGKEALFQNDFEEEKIKKGIVATKIINTKII